MGNDGQTVDNLLNEVESSIHGLLPHCVSRNREEEEGT